MINTNITNKSDLVEALKLQKRQRYEEERMKRIFNTKQRLFGLDLDTLEQQISEKQKQRSHETEYNKRYDEQEQQQRRLIQTKEKELQQIRQAKNSDMHFYRARYQRQEQRREYDLNDPNYLKKSKPLRTGDDDCLLGVSSAQIFSGEDLSNKERQMRQREQQRAWLDQQIRERKQAEEARLNADKLMVESINSREKHIENMAKSEHKIRQQVIDRIRKYNLELAHQKKIDRNRSKNERYEDDMAEIYNMLTSDILTENPNVAQSLTNPNRKIPFMYRGMSFAELDSIRKEQKQQLKELQHRKGEELLLKKQWDQNAIDVDRQLFLKRSELDRKKHQQLNNLIRTNAKLAVEQKLQQKEATNQLLENGISDEFYNQFNKSTR